MSRPEGRSPNETGDTEADPAGPRLRLSFSPETRRKLVRLLVAKSLLDLLFVTALALGSGYTHFGTRFRGAIDYADPRTVRGRVADTAGYERPVEVQLFIDGRFAASVVAGGATGDRQRAFVFHLDPPRTDAREARVYAVEPNDDATRRTLYLVGGPARLAEK